MLFTGKWIELEIIMLSETNQCHEEKYHVFTPLWKLGENKTNQPWS
jgi:hypothetical protein